MSEQTQATTSTDQARPGGGPFNQPVPDQARRAEADNVARNGTVKTIADADYDRLAPADQQRYVRQRDAKNDSIWAERQATDPQQSTDGATRVKLSNGVELSEEQVSDLLRFKGEHETRVATLPATAADYRLDVGDAKIPGDMKVVFDVNDPVKGPLLQAAQAWAHKHQLSQEAFSEALALQASLQAHEAKTIQDARAREVERLGATGPARVTAVSTWLDGVGSPALKQMLVTARIVEQFEGLMRKFTSQGGAPFSQAHRAVQTDTVSDEAWAGMSQAERFDYARSHDQSKFR
jgi:hypothetical protein